MFRSLATAASGMEAQQTKLDVTANNIANVSTNGFKKSRAEFADLMYQNLRPAGAPTGTGANAPSGTEIGLGTRLVSTARELGQGELHTTGNPLDIAIEGHGFLGVTLPTGETAYTRNGALQINSQGQLVTSEGLQVVGQNGPIVFQPTDREISIGIDGLISVREGQNTIDAQRGKLKLASFAQPQRLQKDGTSTYAAPAGVTPQVPTDAKVTQGAVEKSNVQSVMAMTRMVEITRSYTQIAQILQNQSDMRRSAIEKLAEVPTS